MKELYTLLIALFFIGGAMGQSCLPDGITFGTQAEIDSFQVNYPGCSEIEGFVIIIGDDITNLNGLSILTSIGGDLYIGMNFEGNPILADLAGLNNLSIIGGSLTITNNDLLLDFAGLENLNTVNGRISITKNSTLHNFSGLEGLTKVNEFLIGNCSGQYNSGNPSLTSLDGLNNIDTINGTLWIADNDLLVNLIGLDNLSFVGSEIYIGGNDALQSLNGLNSLSHIDYLHIGYQVETWPPCGNPLLTDISALSGLTSAGELYISFCNSLTSLNGLNNINTLGNLFINDNDALVSLSGLENLDSVTHYLFIENNDALTSLSGISNISGESIDWLQIIGNHSLSYCHVKSICEYLEIDEGIFTDNHLGCNSPEEVQDSCIANGVNIEEQLLADKVLIYPNPSSTQITIELPTKLSNNTQLSISSTNGQEVISRNISELKTEINLSQLPQGVYFVKIWDDKNVMVQKVIRE